MNQTLPETALIADSIEVQLGSRSESDENDCVQDERNDEDYDETAEKNDPPSNIQRKRKYSYTNRQKKEHSSPKLRTSWFAALDSMTEAKLRKLSCCKKQCYKHVNYGFYIERCRHLASSAATVRGTVLRSMVDSNNRFMFDGKEVCVRFLRGSFHFSTEFLSRVREEQSKIRTIDNVSNNVQDSVVVSSSHSSRTEDSFRVSPQKDAVISFLLRIAEDCSENMPDANELHLPFFQKSEVYHMFVDEHKKLYDGDPPSSHYFFLVWKTNCSHIKFRKVSRFSICDTCEELRVARKEALLKGDRRAMMLLNTRKAEHIKMVSDERMEYQKKKDRARLNPSEYCSLIIDGADQKAFGLPHFITATKEQKGNAMKLKLIGLLHHDIQNFLHVFTMTEEHETGANHIIECIHRFLNFRALKGPLPRTLFVQVDNCHRENKNRYLLSYLEYLVVMDIFDKVEVGFLPKGHTHEDVDQCFSQSSGRLKRNNAITLLDMHKELSKINFNRTHLSHLKKIFNWSGLCDRKGV